MKDEQIKKGTYTSGLPEDYLEWSLENLKELAKQQQYKKSIEQHLSQFNLSITNREKQINQPKLKFSFL